MYLSIKGMRQMAGVEQEPESETQRESRISCKKIMNGKKKLEIGVLFTKYEGARMTCVSPSGFLCVDSRWDSAQMLLMQISAPNSPSVFQQKPMDIIRMAARCIMSRWGSEMLEYCPNGTGQR